MVQILKNINYFLVFIFLISCNFKSDENDKKNEANKNIGSEIISYNFPDTVKINAVVEGNIVYDIINNDLVNNIINDRFLELLVSTSVNKTHSEYDEVNSNLLISFTDTIPTGKFHFPAVFKNKGKQTLNVVIRDHMFLKPDNNTPSDKVVLRTRDCLFSKEVYVIE